MSPVSDEETENQAQSFRATPLVVVLVLTLAVLVFIAWEEVNLDYGGDSGESAKIEIEQIRGRILHLDEVLTMSANMAVVTGDARWEARYRAYEPLLQRVVSRAFELVPGEERSDFDEILEVKEALFDLENKAFDLIRDGLRDQGEAVLRGDSYARFKKIYLDGMRRLDQTLRQTVQQVEGRERATSGYRALTVTGIAILLIAGWFAAFRMIQRSNKALIHEAAERAIVNAKLRQEIAEREKTERELRISDARFRGIYDHGVGGIAVAAPTVGGKILYANQAWCRLLGYSEEELQELSPSAITHFDDREKSTDMMRRLIAGEFSSYQLEKRYICKSGAVLWALVGISLVRNSDGSPLYTIGEFQDITERKRAIEELRLSEERNRAVLDNVIDGILTADSKGTIRSANPAALRIFGYSENELIGANVAVLAAGVHGPNHHLYLERYLRTGEKRIIGLAREVEGVRADGRVFPLELSLSDILVEGEHLFVAVVRDISERKEMDRMKSEFVSTVSHELRTPLTVILGYLPLLTNADKIPPADRIAKMAMAMEKSGKHLLTLLNDLLDMSKIEAGKLDLSLEDLLLEGPLRSAVDQLRAKANDKNLRINLQLVEGHIFADRVRLEQMLFNLIGNAIKFTDQGHISVRAKQVGAFAEIEVEDTGSGIPEDQYETIFDQFKQADGSVTRKAGGTGLGLSITRRLAELHGGTVTVTSELGKGSCFTLRIPASPGELTS